MKNVVALKEIIKAVELVEAEHRVVQKKLMVIRKVLKLLDPEAEIKLQAGKAVSYGGGWPDYQCKPK